MQKYLPLPTCCLFVVLFFFHSILWAQSKETIIKAGKLFDSEKGVFLKNQQIRIRGNRVVEVGTNLKYKADATIIDLSDATVLPGLIDAHTHLLYLEDITKNPSLESVKAIANEGDALRALRGAARAKTYLEAGFTAVQDLGNSGRYADVALKKAIKEGSVPGPRMRVSGMGLSAVGGQIPGLTPDFLYNVSSKEYRIIKGIDDARLAVRESVVLGADVIKVFSDACPNCIMLTVKEMKTIVDEAHRNRKRVTAHAVFNQAVWNAVMAGVDGIEHGYNIADTTLQLMAKKKVVLVPTFFSTTLLRKYFRITNVTDKKLIERRVAAFIKQRKKIVQRAIKAGVRIVAGSDMYLDMKMPQGEAAKDMLLAYSEIGMPVIEILKSATIYAAEHLRWKNRIGVIKKRAFADIIAVSNGLENDIKQINKIRFVMKNGKVYVHKK